MPPSNKTTTIAAATTTTAATVTIPSSSDHCSMSSHSGGGSSRKSNSSSNNSSSQQQHQRTSASTVVSASKDLPPLFWYMELGEWNKATERLRRHPKEVKTWATVRTKSSNLTAAASSAAAASAEASSRVSGSKRLPLHHVLFKLRSAGSEPVEDNSADDPFMQVCRFVLMLVQLYPAACGQRESRHGCLPIHLAAFASCAPKYVRDGGSSSGGSGGGSGSGAHNEAASISSSVSLSPSAGSMNSAPSSPTSLLKQQQHQQQPVKRPPMIGRRVASDSTNASTNTNLSAVHAEERYAGGMSDEAAASDAAANNAASVPSSTFQPRVVDPNVSLSKSVIISARREAMAVQVLNAILDAYPKGIRVDSEGGRLPLHCACSGRATPRVISTLVTAYPSASRHRNKDGYLPLHLCAHWGVAHPSVAVTLLKAYPDATLGRNRWERTPLEEALCMAGENGRPHQAALVRSLRKHPSFWTRPTADLFGQTRGGLINNSRTSRNSEPTTVDIDESLPSNDSTLEREQATYGFEPDHSFDFAISSSGSSSARGGGGRGRKRIDDPKIPLESLIQNCAWDAVMIRLESQPMAADAELAVMTRGGFMASSGFTPLHYACERKPPAEVVHALIERAPASVTTRTLPGGCLPLHVACTWHASSEVVAALVSADQNSCRVSDELGNIALHSACFSGADVSVVEVLLATDGDSVLGRNYQGSRASDICKRLRHDNRRMVMALLTLTKEEIMARNRRKRSSGTLSDTAREAAELNERLGTPRSSNHEDSDHHGGGGLHHHETGTCTDSNGAIEVSYEKGQEELLWI